MKDENWKLTTYLIGGAVGLVTGLAAAFMYARTAEEHHTQGSVPAKIESGDAFKLGLALIALVRQISDLAVRAPDEHR